MGGAASACRRQIVRLHYSHDNLTTVTIDIGDRQRVVGPIACWLRGGPLAHRAGVVRVGLRLGSSDRDPEIAGGAGFTEGVVRERHGDDGVGGMAGAEDVVDAAKPMLAVEGFHARGGASAINC